VTAIPAADASRTDRSPARDPRFLTFLGGVAMADIGDHAWIVILAYAAALSGDPLTATATVAAGTIPRAILDLVGGAIADRLPTRRLLVGAAAARVVVLALGLVALLQIPERTIPIMIVVAVFFGAADALHKPAVFTMPRQLISVGQLVRGASLRQLANRLAMLGGPALAGVVLAAADVPGAVAGLLLVFFVAAILLSLVRPRYRRETTEQHSLIAATRDVVGYLRQDSLARSLVYSLVGLNFFVIPVINAGVALRVAEEGWGAGVLGLLMGSIGVGAAVGTAVTLRIKPRFPMRFALILLIIQGLGLAMVGVLPMVGVGIALALVGLTAGLSSPMLSGTAQAIVRPSYIGRVFSVVGLADDALVPFGLIGYGLVAGMIGLGPTTVICGAGMAVLMGSALLRRPLRTLRINPAAEASGSATDDAPTEETRAADDRAADDEPAEDDQSARAPDRDSSATG
jgi:MFS family permease